MKAVQVHLIIWTTLVNFSKQWLMNKLGNGLSPLEAHKNFSSVSFRPQSVFQDLISDT